MKFCSNCGTELLPEANFCPICGAKLGISESSESKKNTDSEPFGNSKKSFSESNVSSSQSVKNWFSKTQIRIIKISLGFFVLVLILIYFIKNSDETTSVSVLPSSNTISQSPNVTQDAAANEEAARKAAELEALTARNMSIRNNWESYFLVSRSGFTYSDLGGISNLSIIVTNKSEYKLDRVEVDVMIKTVNGYTYKTEHLYFENIKPYSRAEQYVPSTNRGVSVEYQITSIYSDQLNFLWNKFDNTGNGSLNDPWKFNN